jgi:hypothetical protein
MGSGRIGTRPAVRPPYLRGRATDPPAPAPTLALTLADPTRLRPMIRRFGSPEVGIGLGVWFFLMIAGRSRMFRDPGTFWHTVVGRRILSGAGFFDTDPFSFTHRGQPWIAQQWLGECAMSLIHDRAGLDGLLLATVTILAVLYGWLLGLPTAVLIVLGVASSVNHFHVRPMIFTILGFAMTCAWLGDVEAGRRSSKTLWWLVPIYLIWANTHGGVLGGLATLAFVVGGWCLLGMAGRDSPVATCGDGLRLVLIVLSCAMASLVNPYGVRLPASWLEVMASPVIPRLIIEHAPPRLDEATTAMMGVFGLVYAIAILGVPARQWRVSWLIAPIWLAMACSRVRNAPLFSVAGLVAMADILPRSRLGAWLARPGRDLFRARPETDRRGIGRSWVGPVLLVGMALVLQIAGVRLPILGRGWAHLDPDYWPVDLLPELRQAARADPPPILFNEDVLGGFLIYHVPDLPVFMDDRCELYGDAWLSRYDRAERDPDALIGWLSEYRVDLAMVRTGSGYDRAIAGRAGWSVVRKGAAATLYRRTPSRPVLPDPTRGCCIRKP